MASTEQSHEITGTIFLRCTLKSTSLTGALVNNSRSILLHLLGSMIAPSPGPNATETRTRGSVVVKRKILSWLQQAAQVWFSLQLSHHGGQYSIERMVALDEYTRTTPFWRVLLVCFLTPMPMIALVLAQESIPLQKPEDGWRVDFGIWIRLAILGAVVSHGIAVHATFMLDGVALSSLQLALIGACTGTTYVGVVMWISVFWTFPIPFVGVLFSPILTFAMLLWFRIVAGGEICRRVLGQPYKLLKLTCFVSSQIVMAILYPLFQVLFDRVVDTPYTFPVLMILPVVKLIMKNVLSMTLSHLEDMMPESVIYTVDFFNALYIATCMQSATSTTTVAGIMAVDFAQSAIELYEIHHATKTIAAQMHVALGTEEYSDSFLPAVRELYARAGRIERPDIQIHSCLHLCYAVQMRERVENDAEKDGKAPATGKDKQHSLASIFPIAADSRPSSRCKQSTRKSSTKLRSGGLTSSQMNALRRTLTVLFTSECVLLTEYLEFIIPMLYGCFIVVAVHFQSAKYHSELASITAENLASTVRSLFVYSLLELASFVMLMVLMRRNCGMRGMHHLAFVLETNMPLIQGKQLVWVLMTLAFRVVHFGVDFTFQLAWIGHHRE